MAEGISHSGHFIGPTWRWARKNHSHKANRQKSSHIRSKSKTAVRVVCRFRPSLAQETGEGSGEGSRSSAWEINLSATHAVTQIPTMLTKHVFAIRYFKYTSIPHHSRQGYFICSRAGNEYSISDMFLRNVELSLPEIWPTSGCQDHWTFIGKQCHFSVRCMLWCSWKPSRCLQESC